MPFSGFADLNPDFGSALQRMLAARPGLRINSGYRDTARQAELFRRAVAKYGSEEAARKWVAPPGHSYHNKRLAADLGFASPDDIAWAHQHAGDYGLKFPLGNENWHVELASTRGDNEPAGTGVTVNLANANAMLPTPDATLVAADDMASIFGNSLAQQTRASQQDQADENPKLVVGRKPVVDVPPPVAPPVIPAPATAARDTLSAAPAPVAQLADLFTLPTIGQPAVAPVRPGRPKLPTIGYG
jgi:hypothetical protein